MENSINDCLGSLVAVGGPLEGHSLMLTDCFSTLTFTLKGQTGRYAKSLKYVGFGVGRIERTCLKWEPKCQNIQ